MTTKKAEATLDPEKEYLKLLSRDHCKQTSDGVFSLIPCETDQPFDGSYPIPTQCIVTIAMRERLLRAHYRYFHLIAQMQQAQSQTDSSAQIVQSLAWARHDGEEKILQKAFLKVEACKRKLEYLKIGDDDFKHEKVLKLSPVKEYLTAIERYSNIKAELDTKTFDRIQNMDLNGVQNRYAVEIFSILTEQRTPEGDLVNSFDLEYMLNSPYWSSQIDMIYDAFTLIIEYILTEMQIALKKTESLFETCRTLSEFISAELQTDLETMTLKDGTGKNSSSSSLTSTQEGLDALEKVTQKLKSEEF